MSRNCELAERRTRHIFLAGERFFYFQVPGLGIRLAVTGGRDSESLVVGIRTWALQYEEYFKARGGGVGPYHFVTGCHTLTLRIVPRLELEESRRNRARRSPLVVPVSQRPAVHFITNHLFVGRAASYASEAKQARVKHWTGVEKVSPFWLVFFLVLVKYAVPIQLLVGATMSRSEAPVRHPQPR